MKSRLFWFNLRIELYDTFKLFMQEQEIGNIIDHSDFYLDYRPYIRQICQSEQNRADECNSNRRYVPSNCTLYEKFKVCHSFSSIAVFDIALVTVVVHYNGLISKFYRPVSIKSFNI